MYYKLANILLYALATALVLIVLCSTESMADKGGRVLSMLAAVFLFKDGVRLIYAQLKALAEYLGGF